MLGIHSQNNIFIKYNKQLKYSQKKTPINCFSKISEQNGHIGNDVTLAGNQTEEVLGNTAAIFRSPENFR